MLTDVEIVNIGTVLLSNEIVRSLLKSLLVEAYKEANDRKESAGNNIANSRKGS